MKVAASVLTMGLFGLAAATEAEQKASTGVNPIRKVVGLMQEMQKEVEAEGEEEKDLFEKFYCYCTNNRDALTKQAEDATAEASALSSKVESESGEKKQVDEELSAKKKERAECKADYEKKQKMREKEAAEYATSSAEAKANYDSTVAAIAALEKGSGAAFLQTAGASQRLADVVSQYDESLSMSEKEAVSAFIQASGDYAPQSGQIVGILKNMADEMEKDIATAAADEEAAIKSNDELQAAKKKEYYACTDAVESLTKRSGELAVSVVQNKNAAKDSAEEAEDATNFVANLKKNCVEKKKAFEANQVTRAQEIEAISKAIGILNEDDALDLFKKTLKTPETPAPVMFLQAGVKKGSALAKVRALLATANKSDNKAVALMQHTAVAMIKAQEKSGAQSNFDKVNKMIDDMVAVLKEEADADVESKDYCEKELDTAEDTKTKTMTEGKQLKSQIAQCKDEIAALTEEIKATKARVEATDKSVAEATEQRKKENTAYSTNMQANTMAIELIGKAKNKLMQFYNPDLAVTETEPEMTTGDELAASFVQMKMAQPGPAPETASYSSKGQGASTITALMDKLISELEVGNADAEHEEKTAQKEYEELVTDAQTSTAADKKAISDKDKTKADIEEALGEESREYSLKAAALKDTVTYIADLHKQCDFILAEFDNRVEARSSEVSGLKKAKAVLAGADYKFF